MTPQLVSNLHIFSVGVARTSLRDAARSLLPRSGTAWFDSGSIERLVPSEAEVSRDAHQPLSDHRRHRYCCTKEATILRILSLQYYSAFQVIELHHSLLPVSSKALCLT
ncbi:hypothetical protein [Nostoc sp. CHAB 5715]|uniref:hypothetical protein n=1 Tax=Nostoc sp. CHAB 5715 TaxID=2780400 RepID=UPI001E4CF689|nr:hypothetical protein [Nostoc sp. CHAB 5715]MCC5620030.1 hypothetical protein [Nostoc sp. CHAB 5715]